LINQVPKAFQDLCLAFTHCCGCTILCVYDFHENLHDPSLNHFKGFFYLNSKFYLVDDLEDEYHELKEDFIVNVSCLIYLKS
jgi:hypothetical protein